MKTLHLVIRRRVFHVLRFTGIRVIHIPNYRKTNPKHSSQPRFDWYRKQGDKNPIVFHVLVNGKTIEQKPLIDWHTHLKR